MAGELEFFKQYLTEAPEDESPPDTAQEEAPPDDSFDMGDPPDLPSDDGGGDINEAPPDLGGGDDGGFGDFGSDDDTGSEDDGNDQGGNPMELDEKISAILNHQLYQKSINLLGSIKSKISEIKDNSDVLYTIAPECTKVINKLQSLEENLRLYLKNKFVNEDYGKNRLFFNECLNLLALLSDIFDNIIKKGIKHVDV